MIKTLKALCYSCRTPFSYLLMNLAVSDIMFAVFVAPNHILKKTFTHPEGTGGSELCRMLTSGNFAWVGAASSPITLVAFAVERYYAVIGPLGSKGKLTKRRTKVSQQKPGLPRVTNEEGSYSQTIKNATLAGTFVYLFISPLLPPLLLLLVWSPPTFVSVVPAPAPA